jgi:acyl-CoA reductase-like NAD-dependent aldehyde dehydrogenase
MPVQMLQNRSPGNLDELLEPVPLGDPAEALELSRAAFRGWMATSLDDRIACLRSAQAALREASGELALLIAKEVGKPLTEARGELTAVVAKFDWSFRDAEEYLRDREVPDGPHPGIVRRRPRGPACVIAPFNFPLHLGHGATVAYLLAGNPVLFKPSPLAPLVARRYGEIFNRHLPPGVLQIVQGGGDIAQALALAPEVRSVCFTGSIPVGRSLARSLAEDYSKSLALELGGKNAAVVFADADLPAAARACAEALCLTTGQRCNATNRILVEKGIEEKFTQLFLEELEGFAPGDPLLESTRLGPLANQGAVDRMIRLADCAPGDWLLRPTAPGHAAERRGFYVTPGVLRCADAGRFRESSWRTEEAFSPLVSIEPFSDPAEAWQMANDVEHGLTASVFTGSEELWWDASLHLEVGNLYRNLPTTFSPSSLPFGGWKASGNGKPGARGFVRYASEEQALQWVAP